MNTERRVVVSTSIGDCERRRLDLLIESRWDERVNCGERNMQIPHEHIHKYLVDTPLLGIYTITFVKVYNQFDKILLSRYSSVGTQNTLEWMVVTFDVGFFVNYWP